MLGTNKPIQLKVRQAVCTKCPMSGFVDNPAQDICITGRGPIEAEVMVLTKMPNTRKYFKVVSEQLDRVGINPDKVYYTGAIKCLSFQRNPRRKDVRTCTENYLDKELAIVQPDFILALGNEALQATANHSGITKYRGQVFEYKGAKVFPTVSPAMVLRNPRYRKGWKADIDFFANLVFGRQKEAENVRFHTVDSKAQVKKLKTYLEHAEIIAYDVETTRYEEFKPNSAIVSLSLTLYGDKFKAPSTWVTPLYHPQSIWRTSWQKLLSIYRPYLTSDKKMIAHNGKFDDRWMRQFGVESTCTFDTMLAAHLLDENRSKSLKNLARTMLGAPAWDIETKDLLTTPIDQIIPYNAHDTYWTFQLYKKLRAQLIDRPRLARLFMKLMMPSSALLTRAERRGIWVDRQRLATNTKVAYDELHAIEEQLLEWVPEDIPDDIPTNKRRKGTALEQVNFNPSNFARWWLFEYLDLPVISRGKTKPDGSPGDPSMAKDVLLELRDDHPAVELMLERSTWQKITSAFFDPYNELITENDRIHTTFKLHGTVTGRLSSGKEDEHAITAKVQRRGVNLQQVPRDPLVRGLFGAPPGWTFVEADFSQIELRIVAFLSRDERMLHLYKTGKDIHTATAAWVLEMDEKDVTKADRKKAKAVNFGFVYGMGARRFVHTAFTKYDLQFTLPEAKEVRRAFFHQFSGLPRWHQKQQQLARKYARVLSPLGRVRHLPDIRSSNTGVKRAAERQAINAPVQSFASDLTQLSMIHIDHQFKKHDIRGHVVGSIHDANLLEVKNEYLPLALPLIKDTMQNLPLKRQFGIVVDVPIIADIGVGDSWGEAKELTAEQVYNFSLDNLTN